MWKPGSLFDESIEHGDWYDEGLFSDELYHFGIKGMHWGVRRTPAELGHKPASTGKKGPIGSLKARKAAKQQAKEQENAAKAKKEAEDKAYSDYKKNGAKIAKAGEEKYWKSEEGKKNAKEYQKYRDEYESLLNKHMSNKAWDGSFNEKDKKVYENLCKAEEKYLRGACRAQAEALGNANEKGLIRAMNEETKTRKANHERLGYSTKEVTTKEEAIQRYEDFWYMSAEWQ